jgi:hypothetical protein
MLVARAETAAKHTSPHAMPMIPSDKPILFIVSSDAPRIFVPQWHHV